MEILGKVSRYQVWSKKLVCGFLVDGGTATTGMLLSGISDDPMLSEAKDVAIDDTTVVIREIKIIGEETHSVLVRGRYSSARPPKRGYVANFSGLDGSRSLVLHNQHPTYRRGNDYVWIPAHRRADSSVSIPLNRLGLPYVFYDLEYVAGHLEMCLDNQALSQLYRLRANDLLIKIKDTLQKTYPRWRYAQFKPYFKGIGIYKQR